jgi:5-methylcytosine-specific restriction endonuclease McrA
METIEQYATHDQITASEQRERLFNALDATRWNATKAAYDLGINFRKMRYRMAKCGIKKDTDIGRKPMDKGWLKLRYHALMQYGNRCHCCGSTPRTGAVLHVDHVKPRHKYPDLAMDINNLQILCAPCHRSKGANDETDWRT